MFLRCTSLSEICAQAGSFDSRSGGSIPNAVQGDSRRNYKPNWLEYPPKRRTVRDRLTINFSRQKPEKDRWKHPSAQPSGRKHYKLQQEEALPDFAGGLPPRHEEHIQPDHVRDEICQTVNPRYLPGFRP